MPDLDLCASWIAASSRLKLAIEKDHAAAAKMALQQDPKLVHELIENGLNEEPVRPLMWACMNEAHACAKLLLESGAKQEYRRRYSENNALTLDQPMFWSVEDGDVEMVKILLEHGARIRQTTPDEGYCPFHAAILFGSLDIAQLFLDRGFNVDWPVKGSVRPDKRKTTALHLVAAYNEPARVLWLLARGADPKIKNADGHTPLEIAQFHKRDITVAAIQSWLAKQVIDKPCHTKHLKPLSP